ncbi:ribosome rescue protein RqcH [Halobium palmae]|uniref:Archaeal Rqc2 homolog aRqcH n=1 Tax=Halobium palmae TaxID=1776492 RepID=A0ABD5RY82_9EURY
MDPKRELTSIDLAALTTELGRYEGAKVDKAYLYDDDLLRLKLRDFDRGRVELLLEVGDTKRAHVATPEHVPEAPGRPPNFAMMLRNRLNGADFAGVEQFEFDRILTFSFERGDENTDIVVELFGQGNVAVLDETGEVVQCLDTVRLKSRTVAPGSQYGFPASRVNPLTASYERFAANMEDSDTDVVRTLATQLNFGGLWGEELCTRAGVEKTLDIADATEEEYRALYDAVQRVKAPIRTGELDPRVYFEPAESDGESAEDGGSDGNDDDGGEEPDPAERVVDVTPIPMEEHAGEESEAFDSFNAALDEYFYRLAQEAEETAGAGGAGGTGGGRQRPDFEEQIEKQQRIIEQQEGAIEGFEREAAAEREKAESLYANYELVDEVLSTVRSAREESVPWDDIEEKLAAGAERGIPAAEAVVGVDGAEGTVSVEIGGNRIDLDVSTGVEKNADRLYTEAKRIEGKKEGALEAIEDTREELEAVKKRREEWEAADEEDGDDGDEEGEFADVDWLTRESIPVRQSEQWYERFRWFETSDGFLVIGGRNADQNEEIVKKYLGKHDLFFHTQSHGGPVTVVKATGPSEAARDVDIPERSREEAAQFAVSYSSVWKDGRHADDAYLVDASQVSKTPESGEYLEKGGFAIRGDREYYRDVACEIAVGIRCEPDTRVVGGPPSAIEPTAETSVTVRPGRYAQNDMAKMLYREFRERFADQSFVRKVASADRIQEFLPPGGSEMEGE